MKKILSAIKPYLRWFILGGTLFFLLKTFKDNWQEVTAVQVNLQGWLMLAAAVGVTLMAHIWSGWVWTLILAAFQHSLGKLTGICVYLTTNIAKYLPGNVWHFYGRISAVSRSGGSLGTATLSVLLEPLLMAAAALLIALTSTGLGWLKTDFNLGMWSLQISCLIAVLVGIHPRILNPLMHWLSRSKGDDQAAKKVNLNHYPLIPLCGEIGFLILRGTGFLFTVMAIAQGTIGESTAPILPEQIPSLISAFSFAWLLGLVVPGAPGGMGIFEATAIALLARAQFSPAIILTAVACFRVVSILAEAIAALIAWLIVKK